MTAQDLGTMRTRGETWRDGQAQQQQSRQKLAGAMLAVRLLGRWVQTQIGGSVKFPFKLLQGWLNNHPPAFARHNSPCGDIPPHLLEMSLEQKAGGKGEGGRVELGNQEQGEK